MLPIIVFATRAEDKKSAVIVCATHMELILHGEVKYQCVSEMEGASS